MFKLIRAVVILGVVVPAVVLAQYYPGVPDTPNPGAYHVAGSFHGKLKELTSKEIMIQMDDDQILSIHRARKTKFLKGARSIKASDIDVDTLVTVEASEDVDLSLTAVSVSVDTPKKSADRNK